MVTPILGSQSPLGMHGTRHAPISLSPRPPKSEVSLAAPVIEAGDDLLVVHALLDQLQGDLALDRLALRGEPDLAHAALTDFFQKTIGSDLRGGLSAPLEVDG